MTWGQNDSEEDPNMDKYSFKNAKNKNAAIGYHDANMQANIMNTKSVTNKKMAIFDEIKK